MGKVRYKSRKSLKLLPKWLGLEVEVNGLERKSRLIFFPSPESSCWLLLPEKNRKPKRRKCLIGNLSSFTNFLPRRRFSVEYQNVKVMGVLLAWRGIPSPSLLNPPNKPLQTPFSNVKCICRFLLLITPPKTLDKATTSELTTWVGFTG